MVLPSLSWHHGLMWSFQCLVCFNLGLKWIYNFPISSTVCVCVCVWLGVCICVCMWYLCVYVCGSIFIYRAVVCTCRYYSRYYTCTGLCWCTYLYHMTRGRTLGVLLCHSLTYSFGQVFSLNIKGRIRAREHWWAPCLYPHSAGLVCVAMPSFPHAGMWTRVLTLL